ncbi:MAG TPA: carboxylating nicotinate-nucleotide diphosphorylase [Bryobacteraceae bacterium]|nr:carboxylating nicotinate-nucleotide diphosphorylase [Bryobacteraceae bacterium]
MLPQEVVDLVRRALVEDIGSGDITTELCIPARLSAVGRMVARQTLTLAGVELIPLIFEELAPGSCEIELKREPGARLNSGDEIAVIDGPARVLLTGERTALNFVQRLSGVATLTSAFVDAVKGTGCLILDTRKTTPGLRLLEKMAVAAGGGTNHRMGLHDAVLIKNNHIRAAGGVRAALDRTQDAGVPIEIEVRTKAELDEALDWGATHLLLDNLSPKEAREWMRHIAGRAKVELSGGITLDTVRACAESGADFISVGALTHSAAAVDINFRLELD